MGVKFTSEDSKPTSASSVEKSVLENNSLNLQEEDEEVEEEDEGEKDKQRDNTEKVGNGEKDESAKENENSTSTQDDAQSQKRPGHKANRRSVNQEVVKTGASGENIRQLKNIVDKVVKEHKTFCIEGQFSSIRNAMKQRGWLEKREGKWGASKSSNVSDSFQSLILQESEKVSPEIKDVDPVVVSRLLKNTPADFLWTAKASCAMRHEFRGNQLISRFPRTGFNTKVGLCTSLEQMHWFYEEGVSHTLFPRCYNICSLDELSAFKDDFRLTACQSLLKWIIKKYDEHQRSALGSPSGKIPPSCVDFAVKRCNTYVSIQNHEDIDKEDNYGHVWDYQWDQFLTWYYMAVHDGQTLLENRNYKPEVLYKTAKDTLQSMKRYCPQQHLDGTLNIWILKPGANSRGRGIILVNKLETVLSKVRNYVMKESRFVIQKYIEEPLLIYRTKFDIRQWFLITSSEPLTIWMYKTSYLRFCSQNFDLQNFHESVHLCNNAVQCKYKNGKRDPNLPEENMWDCYTFQTYLKAQGKSHIWSTKIYPGMRQSIIGAILSAQDNLDRRKNCFELFGADFMLDREFTPWLLEINSCPSMSNSTSVTARLCSQCLEDVIKVVIDRRYDKKADTGQFELIFKQQMPPCPTYLGMTLSVKGEKILNQDKARKTSGSGRKGKTKNSSNTRSQQDSSGDSDSDASSIAYDNIPLLLVTHNEYAESVFNTENDVNDDNSTNSDGDSVSDNLLENKQNIFLSSDNIDSIAHMSTEIKSDLSQTEQVQISNVSIPPKDQQTQSIIIDHNTVLDNDPPLSPKFIQLSEKLDTDIDITERENTIYPNSTTQSNEFESKLTHKYPEELLESLSEVSKIFSPSQQEIEDTEISEFPKSRFKNRDQHCSLSGLEILETKEPITKIKEKNVFECQSILKENTSQSSCLINSKTDTLENQIISSKLKAKEILQNLPLMTHKTSIVKFQSAPYENGPFQSEMSGSHLEAFKGSTLNNNTLDEESHLLKSNANFNKPLIMNSVINVMNNDILDKFCMNLGATLKGKEDRTRYGYGFITYANKNKEARSQWRKNAENTQALDSIQGNDTNKSIPIYNYKKQATSEIDQTSQSCHKRSYINTHKKFQNRKKRSKLSKFNNEHKNIYKEKYSAKKMSRQKQRSAKSTKALSDSYMNNSNLDKLNNNTKIQNNNLVWLRMKSTSPLDHKAEKLCNRVNSDNENKSASHENKLGKNKSPARVPTPPGSCKSPSQSRQDKVNTERSNISNTSIENTTVKQKKLQTIKEKVWLNPVNNTEKFTPVEQHKLKSVTSKEDNWKSIDEVENDVDDFVNWKERLAKTKTSCENLLMQLKGFNKNENSIRKSRNKLFNILSMADDKQAWAPRTNDEEESDVLLHTQTKRKAIMNEGTYYKNDAWGSSKRNDIYRNRRLCDEVRRRRMFIDDENAGMKNRIGNIPSELIGQKLKIGHVFNTNFVLPHIKQKLTIPGSHEKQDQGTKEMYTVGLSFDHLQDLQGRNSVLYSLELATIETTE